MQPSVVTRLSAALDAQAEFELFQRLRSLTEGRTAIFISHRFSSVRLADRILVLEKGRLVDFLMEDLTPYDDAQVGAAARVVHQGCRQVLQESFSITPITEAEEGSQVTVPAGYAADEYRIVGKLSGDPPFTGKLVHKGWKTESIKLPRLVNAGSERLPAIAPAEVEIT